MQRDPKMYMADMLRAVETVEGFTTGKSFADFEGDLLFKSGVYWQLAIIGEALSQLRKIDEAISDRITESWRIIGFRNQILHGYHSISDAITWRIIQDKLPQLKSELKALLAL